MIQKQQGTRTQITDLPEIAIELSENELRIVSGGVREAFACYGNVAPPSDLRVPTNVGTGNDWDSD
jgi:hypothetical protein